MENSSAKDYRCCQVFGYKGNDNVHEEDIISSLKFDQEGKHVALGDKAGRVIIFKIPSNKRSDGKLSYFTQFQAYSQEFDPLNSSDIDQEILGIKWLSSQGPYKKILTMNSKEPKLWKIFEKTQKKISRIGGKDLTLPKFQCLQNNVNAVLQKSFLTTHQEDLIGFDCTKNEQYIVCSDTVKAVLWDMEKSKSPYLIADLQKNLRIQDVKENINCIRTHPNSDSLFAFGTNCGSICLSDMRISQSYRPLTFKMESKKQKANQFTKMISSYSDLIFANESRYIVARDYLSLKIWDLAKNDKPIASIILEDSLKSKICQVFQNDCIFDKFTVSKSKDSNTILTGTYNNCFHAVDLKDLSNTQYEISYKKQTISKQITKEKNAVRSKMDYIRKTQALDFHPKQNLFAVASLNSFLTYAMKPK